MVSPPYHTAELALLQQDKPANEDHRPEAEIRRDLVGPAWHDTSTISSYNYLNYITSPEMRNFMPGMTNHALAFTSQDMMSQYVAQYVLDMKVDLFYAFRVTACGRIWIANGTVLGYLVKGGVLHDPNAAYTTPPPKLSEYLRDLEVIRLTAARVRLHIDPKWRRRNYWSGRCGGCGLCPVLRKLSDFPNLRELDIAVHHWQNAAGLVTRSVAEGINEHLQGHPQLQTVTVRLPGLGAIILPVVNGRVDTGSAYTIAQHRRNALTPRERQQLQYAWEYEMIKKLGL